MSITLLRHAAVSLQFQKRYLGSTDVDIDESLFVGAKVEDLKHKDFDLVYASSLKRTAQTLEKLGKTFIVDARINEVKFKEEIELKNFEEVAKLSSYDEKYLSSYKSWSEYICLESIEEFRARIDDFMNQLPKNKDILICTHAGVLKMLANKNFEYLDRYVIS